MMSSPKIKFSLIVDYRVASPSSGDEIPHWRDGLCSYYASHL